MVTAINSDPTYPVGTVVPIRNFPREDLHFIQRRIAGLRRRLHRWDWPWFGHYKTVPSAGRSDNSPASPDAVILFNDLVVREISAANCCRLKAKILGLAAKRAARLNQRDLPAKTVSATTMFLTCSQYIKDWTCATHRIAPEKVVVAHSGSPTWTHFRSGRRFPGRQQTLRALFVGRIDPNKGPDIVADAAAALRAEGTLIELTVAGGVWFYGTRTGDAGPVALSCKLKGKMDAVSARYLGHVARADLPAIVRAHDIAFVLSRSNEPFGLGGPGSDGVGMCRDLIPTAAAFPGSRLRRGRHPGEPRRRNAVVGHLRAWPSTQLNCECGRCDLSRERRRAPGPRQPTSCGRLFDNAFNS